MEDTFTLFQNAPYSLILCVIFHWYLPTHSKRFSLIPRIMQRRSSCVEPVLVSRDNKCHNILQEIGSPWVPSMGHIDIWSHSSKLGAILISNKQIVVLQICRTYINAIGRFFPPLSLFPLFWLILPITRRSNSYSQPNRNLSPYRRTYRHSLFEPYEEKVNFNKKEYLILDGWGMKRQYGAICKVRNSFILFPLLREQSNMFQLWHIICRLNSYFINFMGAISEVKVL